MTWGGRFFVCFCFLYMRAVFFLTPFVFYLVSGQSLCHFHHSICVRQRRLDVSVLSGVGVGVGVSVYKH